MADREAVLKATETLEQTVEKLARELCSGCRDGLYFDGEVHLYADGSNYEICKKEYAAEKLRAAYLAGQQQERDVADKLLTRCQAKMRQLVEQNGGEYKGGEPVQFIHADINKWRAAAIRERKDSPHE